MNSAESRRFVLSHVVGEIACVVRAQRPDLSGLAGRLSETAARVAFLQDEEGSTGVEWLELAAEVHEAAEELALSGWLVGSFCLEGVESRLVEAYLETGQAECQSLMSGVRVLTGPRGRRDCLRPHVNRPPGGLPWTQRRSSS